MAILTEVKASSYSYYDVFLSFRGLDTRLGFTNYLYHALLGANLATFRDNEEIPTGEHLKPELETAIKASRASIIVLSENYASSTWCLDELVLILEQKRDSNQIVIPVFYHVEPTHVRKQQSSFGKAMEKHKLKIKEARSEEERRRLGEKMKKWKDALTQVSHLKGKDATGRMEKELIEDIVHDIYRRLDGPLGTTTLPQLIGMEDDIKRIASWLKDRSEHTADILTIWGMGGIGKTSLASYVYAFHRTGFTSFSFVRDISRRCAGNQGMLDLQKQLYSDISNRNLTQVHNVAGYTSMICEALAHEKVLVVLDDIDSFQQLDKLLGDKGFHPGSKVIITTKDASLTEKCALFNPQVQPNHMKVLIKGLDEAESLELLCIHAFKSQNPKEGFEDVSEKIVKYCDGNPLALQVLGKALRNCEDIDEWEYYIEGLKKEPDSPINNALRMSFDSLPLINDKDLFKHIACFFVGIDKDLTETILNSCGINTRYGIRNLIDRCLLSIRGNNKLAMHQLVQDMGRELVRQESPDMPWERSRLWCHKESYEALKRKKGTGKILGFALDLRTLETEKLAGSLQLETDALNKMDNLKLLQLNYVKINGSYENISKELRWLCMHGFHLDSIPSDLPMENLVFLDMSHSKIKSFNMSCSSSRRSVERLEGLTGSSSKDKRLLGSLKILDLSFCKQLISVCGFMELPLLERLEISNCTSLTRVGESIGHCVELVFIDLSHCRKLKELPRSIGKLKKVKTLLMSDVEIIPRDIRSFMSCLPISLVHLSLRNINLSNESFPKDFSSLSSLKELYLDGNLIVSMPSCVTTVPRLELLSMNGCIMLETVARPPPTLRRLLLTSPSSQAGYINFLSKVLFNPETPLLDLKVHRQLLGNSSFEIEGMVKIQPMAHVEEKILDSLGWSYLWFVQYHRVTTSHSFRGALQSPVQMYYEFGIFSTFFWGTEIPIFVSHSSKGSSISLTIPSSPKTLRGLNICSVQKFQVLNKDFFTPLTIVSNITKNLTWIYNHYIFQVKVTEESLILISHWMLGKNEMEDGDQVTITIGQKNLGSYCMEATECGIGLVYDEDGKTTEEEEDVLGYYKSWNHIIGGDLSAFQLTTGQYILNNDHFLFPYEVVSIPHDLPSIELNASYKERRVRFRPFSQQKFDVNGNRTQADMFS